MALQNSHAAILDRLIDMVHAAGPIAAQTDKYFTNTSRIVDAHGDQRVTFAIFMRRRVVAAGSSVERASSVGLSAFSTSRQNSAGL